MCHWENVSEIARLFSFWSTFTYIFEKINDLKIDVNHCTFLCQLSQKLAIHHFLTMVILRVELMSFIIIYVDNVQQHMQAPQAKFVKLHNVYILKNILTYKFKIHALCN